LGEAFSHVGLDWHELVEIDPKYYRPAEVECLLGDASKAKQNLGWQAKTKFKQLARLMVDADLAIAKREAHLNGYEEPAQLRRSVAG
jgi:GDPmannose 4,6-dehydratase